LAGTTGGSWDVDWGDGNSDTYSPGDTPSHTWTDDNPTNTPQDDYTITWAYTDRCGNVLPSQTSTITIDDVKPIASDDSASTTADTPVVIDVRANDTDPGPDDTIPTVSDYDVFEIHWGTVAIVTDPTVGSAIEYHPAGLESSLYLGHTVTERFKYKVKDDDTKESEFGTVTVTATGTEKHDRAVKWNVDMGLAAKVNQKLDELGTQLKNHVNVAPNLNDQAYADEPSFNTGVEGIVSAYAPDLGPLNDLIQGLKDQLGNWAQVTVEALIDGVIAYLKTHVNTMVESLLPTYTGFLQDPILMGCNIKGAPALGPNPPSIGGTVTFSVNYTNPNGNFSGPEWTNEGNNEPSELPGVREEYTAFMNVILTIGINISILGNTVNVQVTSPVFANTPVNIECVDAIDVPVVIST